MPDRERIVKQLEADLSRAERTGEMMVCVGRKTAAAAIALLKEQQKEIEDRTKEAAAYAELLIKYGLI